MPLPSSGTISFSQINAEFGRGTNLNAYRGAPFWLPNNATTFFFPTGTISFSDFYGKLGASPVVPGTATYTSPGSYSFSVPIYNSIRVEVYGGGGGAAYYDLGQQAAGNGGGTSTAAISQGTLTATGGQGGLIWTSGTSVGGTGSGPSGSYTETGGSSAQAQPYPTGGRGAGPGGGAGGYWPTSRAGAQPGGGGAAYSTLSPGGNFRSVSGGGGGGYVRFETTAAVGATIAIVVGAGGTGFPSGSGANGGAGLVRITWS